LPVGDFFPPDAVVRRVDGEAVLLLGGGRALLMQLAHPMVARGVAEHSQFEADPFSRLQRTLDAVTTIVFGTDEEARHVAAVVGAVHERVVGDGYRASDPELLMWVHATLVDTALRVHARFLRPLRDGEAERYYAESMEIAELLGVPHQLQPPDLAAFRTYVRRMVGSLEVSDEARKVADAIFHPRAIVLQPAFLLARELTAGLLPPPLRRGFRLSWDPPRQAVLLAAALASRSVLPRLPSRLRRVPV
jgi:uncharacterized protein (DUF2236 family)